jgi:hypothetical protein
MNRISKPTPGFYLGQGRILKRAAEWILVTAWRDAFRAELGWKRD